MDAWVQSAEAWAESTGSVVAALWDDLFFLIPAYMCFVGVGTRVQKLPSINWRPVMAAYNLAMTLFSLGCWVAMVEVLRQHEWKFAGPECGRFAESQLFKTVVYLFYLSKYVEFADTLFLIAKGKPVTWLHYFHHCGAAVNMGLLCNSKMEAVWLFVLLNGFVHTIMYAYYGCALLGYRLKGKSAITSMQIVQFLTGMSVFWQYKHVPCFRESEELMFVFWFTYAYVGVVLLFFCNFFAVNYLGAKKAKKATKTA